MASLEFHYFKRFNADYSVLQSVQDRVPTSKHQQKSAKLHTKFFFIGLADNSKFPRCLHFVDFDELVSYLCRLTRRFFGLLFLEAPHTVFESSECRPRRCGGCASRYCDRFLSCWSRHFCSRSCTDRALCSIRIIA